MTAPQPGAPLAYSPGALPVIVTSGDGRTTARPDEIDIEIAVLPPPVNNTTLCGSSPSLAGIQRALRANELDAAINTLTRAGFLRRDMRARLTPVVQRSGSARRNGVMIGQIEIAVRAPLEKNVVGAVNRMAGLFNDGRGWAPENPIRLNNLALRMHSCSDTKDALEAGFDDARRNALAAAGALNLTLTSLANYQATRTIGSGAPAYVCGNAFGALSYWQERSEGIDLRNVQLLGQSIDSFELPRFQAQFRGGGVFGVQGALRETDTPMPVLSPQTRLLARTTLPMSDSRYISRTILLSAKVPFVTGNASYSFYLQDERNDHTIDPQVAAILRERAVQQARVRATAIAWASHRGLGRFLVANFGNVRTSSQEGDLVMVTQAVVAAWELVGPTSRDTATTGIPDLGQYNLVENDMLYAIVPSFNRNSVEGTAQLPLAGYTTEAECTAASRRALADAVVDALKKSEASPRAILDEGDAFNVANRECASQLRPFGIEFADVNGPAPFVREGVVVVP